MCALRTLPAALDHAARAGTGLWFVAADSEHFRSYADLQLESLRVACALLDAGLERGAPVAIVLSDAEQFLTTLFGASIAELLPVSLAPPSTTAQLARYVELAAITLRASGARAVVTTGSLVPSFEAARASCPELSLVLARETFDAPPLEPRSTAALDDLVFVQFTSGSTAVPKGVALTHANLCANIDAIHGPAGLATTDEDIGVSWLPLNHDMGLVGMALGSMYSARPCVILPPHVFVKRPVEWLRAITRHRGTVSFAPNFAYDWCVRRVKTLEGLDLSSWRVAGCGAEPIHAPTLAAFADMFGAAGFRSTSFLPGYGLAEHVLAATFASRDRRPSIDRVSGADLTERRIAVPHGDEGPGISLVSCGHPFPEHQLRIVDDDGRPLPERHVGEIVLAGPSVMHGYYGQPEMTAEAIRNGWLHTGDLGYLADGELFVCGRAKEIIVVSGRKYHPQDLEWAIGDLPGLRRGHVVAFGVSEPGRADRVVVVLEANGTLAAEALVEAVRRRMGDVLGLVVDDVAIVPSGTVGRTTSGKLQRAAAKARYERGEFAAVPSEG